MDAYPELTRQIRAALAGGEQTLTTELQALYRQAYGEPCHRRGRMVYKLQIFLNKWSTEEEQTASQVELLSSSSSTMAASENYRFKSAFKKKKALVHTPETRFVTASTLQDADVPVLKEYGLGHFVEVIPGREEQAAQALEPKTEEPEVTELPSLSVNKPELQAIYEKELGTKPSEDLRVEDLKEAITKNRSTTK